MQRMLGEAMLPTTKESLLLKPENEVKPHVHEGLHVHFKKSDSALC